LREIPEESRLLGAGYGDLQLQVHFAVYAIIDLRDEEHLRDGHLAVNVFGKARKDGSRLAGKHQLKLLSGSKELRQQMEV
jgi:hypothetical protein